MLQELQWELVGFETGADGQPDTRRPMHRCPACRQYKDAATMATLHKGNKFIMYFVWCMRTLHLVGNGLLL
jgi:hypothetical protein